METYNFTDGSIAGQVIPRAYNTGENQLYIRRNFVDFSKQSLDAGNADVAQVINIPAGVCVIDAWLRVITKETADGTVDLGYSGSGTDVDHWGAALAVDSAVGTILRLPTTTDAPPIYFSSAGTIDIKATTDTNDVDIDGLKCEVVALCVNCPDSF